MSMKNKQSILIIAFSGRIGDTLLMTPAIRSISDHFQGHEIHVMAHKNTIEILKHLSFINRLSIISRRSAHVKGYLSFRKHKCGFIFTSPGEEGDNGFIRYAQRTCHKVAAQTKRKDIFISSPIYSEGQNVIEYFLQLPRDCGIACDSQYLSYTVTDTERQCAHTFLENILPKDRLLVGLQLSSFGTRSYRDWPLQSYKDLCTRLIELNNNIHFIIFGTLSDRPKAGYISNGMDAYVHDCTGMSIRPTAALMEQIDLYIGPDTGPSHIMSTFNKPMIVMHHCMYPSKQFRRTPCPDYIIYIDMDTDKPCNESRSMGEVTVDTVYSYGCKLLGLKKE